MQKSRNTGRQRRHRRVRKKIVGTKDRARLVVFRSSLHIYAQLVDDAKGHVLASSSSLKLGDVVAGDGKSKSLRRARVVGLAIAERAKSKGIESVAFDRSGYKYHGRVAALAEGAREGGLKF